MGNDRKIVFPPLQKGNGDEMENLQIYNAVKSVPEAAKRKITGGRMNGKTDINPMWRIKMLTEQFGPCGIGWYYEVENRWLEKHGEEVAAFVAIRMYIKVAGEWSKPIPGIGGSMFAEIQKGMPHVSDECYKMATTDAISVACKQLGIAADVYWEKDTTKYTEENPEASAENRKRLEEVERELKRTGYSPKSICRTYHIESVYELSDLQIKDFLKKIANVPDKEEA